MALTANTVLSSTATSKFLSLISHFFPNRYVFSPGPTIAMFWYLRFQNSISSHYPPSKNLSFPGGRSRCSASGIVPLPSSSIDDWASRSLVKWLISVKPPWDFWDHECTITDNLDITYIPMLMIENGRRFLCFVVIYIYIQYTYVHTQTIWLVTFWVYFISTCVFGTHLPWRSLSFFLVYQVYPKFQRIIQLEFKSLLSALIVSWLLTVQNERQWHWGILPSGLSQVVSGFRAHL